MHDRQRRQFRLSLVAWLLLGVGVTARGQEARRIETIRDLPRPGYEIGRWQVGSTLLLPSVSVGVSHDSNVFATSVDTVSDAVFDIRPRLEIENRGSDLQISGDIYANGRFLAEQTTENAVAFGLGGSATYAAGSRSKVSASLRYDRDYQRRSDPEADPLLREPAKFDLFSAEIGYGYRGNRFGISFSGSVQKTNFLDAAEDDRDMTTWRAPLRLSYAKSAAVQFFVEPYVNYRDARLPVDRDGVNRDVLTYGALGGVLFDITDKLHGEVGAGVFRAEPKAPLDAFSGVAFNGRLTWSPDARALVTFVAFRGDVATIQAGANGRIDTRVQVRLDQEVRHNLLFNTGIGFRRTSYRGNLDRKLRVLSADAELEYLATRTISVFVNASHETRSATDPLDRFNRTTAGIGIRLRI